MTVETLPRPAGELEVHQVVAGLLGGKLPVEVLLVTPLAALTPHQLLGLLQTEVHLLTAPLPGTIRASSKSGGDAGRCRVATDHRNQHQRYFIPI